MSDNLEQEVLGQCAFELENNKIFIKLFALGKTTFLELYNLTTHKVYCTQPIEKQIGERQVTRIFNYFTTSPTTTIIGTPQKSKDQYLIEIGLEEFVLKCRELNEEDEINFDIGSIQMKIDTFQAQKQKEITLLDDELNVLEKKNLEKQKKLELTRNELLQVEEQLTSQEQKFLKQEQIEKQKEEEKKPKIDTWQKKTEELNFNKKKKLKNYKLI